MSKRQTLTSVFGALIISAMTFAIIGCSNTAQRTALDLRTLEVPAQWQSVQEHQSAPITTPLSSPHPLAQSQQTGWIYQFNDPALVEWVQTALEKNPGLLAKAAQVRQSEQGVKISGASVYPSLDLTASRRRVESDTIQSTTDSLSLDARYELDLWGKLSAQAQQANYSYAATKASFSSATLALSAEVASAWYRLILQQELLVLAQQREDTLNNALLVVQQAYQRGLKSATELQSAQTALQQERATGVQQKQALSEQVRVLQQLLGRYPNGDPTLAKGLNLPILPAFQLQTLPSELISRQPDLQSAWLSLLAADAAMAMANKARFPSLAISASVNQHLDWSLMASLTQPLFNAGKLAAAEVQAGEKVQQLEKEYLQALFSAFAKVEDALLSETSLQHRYQLAETHLENARRTTAIQLSQYQLGQIELSQLLATQKTMIDSQAARLELQHQQIQNRIRLYQALGGQFSDEMKTEREPADTL